MGLSRTESWGAAWKYEYELTEEERADYPHRLIYRYTAKGSRKHIHYVRCYRDRALYDLHRRQLLRMNAQLFETLPALQVVIRLEGLVPRWLSRR